MGGVCCNAQGGPGELMAMNAQVQLFGDYLDSDTRAILVMLDKCEIKVKFHLIDTLSG